MSPLRTLGKAVVFAILGMALMFFTGTFLGIVALAIVGAIRGERPDMSISYRIVGLSTAAMGFFGGFLLGVIRDLRRQS